MSHELSLFEREAVRMALVKMFDGQGYFDICTVDTCVKITGAIPTPRDYAALRALHCVSWSLMTPDMRREVGERVLKVLAEPSFSLPQISRSFLPPAVEGEAKKSSLVRRLFGAA